MPISVQGRLKVGLRVAVRGREACWRFQTGGVAGRGLLGPLRNHAMVRQRRAMLSCGHLSMIRLALAEEPEAAEAWFPAPAVLWAEVRLALRHGFHNVVRWMLCEDAHVRKTVQTSAAMHGYTQTFSAVLAFALSGGAETQWVVEWAVQSLLEADNLELGPLVLAEQRWGRGRLRGVAPRLDVAKSFQRGRVSRPQALPEFAVFHLLAEASAEACCWPGLPEQRDAFTLRGGIFDRFCSWVNSTNLSAIVQVPELGDRFLTSIGQGGNVALFNSIVPIPFAEQCAIAAARAGQLQMLEAILLRRPNNFAAHELLLHAAQGGHLATTEWIIARVLDRVRAGTAPPTLATSAGINSTAQAALLAAMRIGDPELLRVLDACHVQLQELAGLPRIQAPSCVFHPTQIARMLLASPPGALDTLRFAYEAASPDALRLVHGSVTQQDAEEAGVARISAYLINSALSADNIRVDVLHYLVQHAEPKELESVRTSARVRGTPAISELFESITRNSWSIT